MINYLVELISPQPDGSTVTTQLNVNLDFSEDERLDELLDTFDIEVWNKNKEPFSILDNIKITAIDKFDNQIISYYAISEDVPVLIGRNPSIYEHTISLIELTKTLDGYTLPSINFIQPLDEENLRYPTLTSMLERLLAIYNVEIDAYYNQTRRFTLSQNLKDITDNIVPAQTSIKEPTLREGLNELLRQVNAVVRLLPGNIIDADFFNNVVKNVNIEDNEISDYRSQQSLQLYGTTIESTAKNIINDGTANNIPVSFPPSKAWTTIRTSDIIIDENLAAINIPGIPIYEISKLLVKSRVDNLEYDISNYIAESKAYDVLPTEGWVTGETGNFKQNTLQYEFNGNSIFGFGTEFKTGTLNLFITPVWKEVFKSAGVPLETNLTDYLFKVKYVPIIKDDRFRIQREDIDIINKQYTFKTNQSEQINEFSKFARNVHGQIQRLGNPIIEVATVVTDFSKLHAINTYVLNYDSIITEREFRYLRNHLFVMYRLDKNWNRIANFIGVDAERRETDIPVDKDTLFRNIIYEDYCIVNLDGEENNNSHLTALGKQYFLETLLNKFTRGIDNALFVSDESGGLIVPIVPKGGRSTLKFNYAFDNPIFAGKTITNNDLLSGVSFERDTEQGAKYTKDDGSYNRLALSYGVIYGNNTNSFSEDEEIGRLYPKISYESLIYNPLIEIGNIVFDETSAQIISKDEGVDISSVGNINFSSQATVEQLKFDIVVRQGGVPITPLPGQISFEVSIDNGKLIKRVYNITQDEESFVFPINAQVKSSISYKFISVTGLTQYELTTNLMKYTQTIPNPNNSLRAFKDPGEVQGGVYQLHVIPGKSELGEIIIGDAFCEFNNLIGGGLDRGISSDIVVYGTTTRYQKFDRINIIKDRFIGDDAVIDLDINNNRVTILDIQQNPNESWAIGTPSGQLILAVNPPRTVDDSGIAPKTVSFDLQHLDPRKIYN